MYPSVSLELLTIAQIAVIFSSSTVEEAIMCRTPVLDLVVDRDLDRLEFLYTTPLVYKMKYWVEAGFIEYRQAIQSLTKASNSPELFNRVAQKYLQTSALVGPKILDHFSDKIIQHPVYYKEKPYLWLRYTTNYHASFTNIWSRSLKLLTKFNSPQGSPRLYSSLESYHQSLQYDEYQQPIVSVEPWLAIVHSSYNIVNLVP